MSKILRNAIRTPDGTEIVSRYVHDYNCHRDTNGETYCVDGGNEYLRRTHSKALDYIELSIHDDQPHEFIREHVEWGRLKANGMEHDWIKIKDLADDHLLAIVEGGYAKRQFLQVMVDEIDWRGL